MARSPIVEDLLTRRGYDYQYRGEEPGNAGPLALTAIDLAASMQNNARIGLSVHPETVERYTMAMEAGAAFPALVTYELAPGYWMVLDGIQRLHAALAVGRRTFDAYVVDATDPTALDLLARSINLTTTGFGVTRADAIQQALRLLELYPSLSAAHVASLFYLKESALSRRLYAERVQAELVEGPRPVDTSTLPLTALVEIGAVRNDAPRKEFARLAVEAKLPTEDVARRASELTKLRSESAQTARVAEWRREPRIVNRIALSQAGETKVALQQRDSFFRMLGMLMSFLDKYRTLEAAQLTDPEDQRRAVAEWRRIAERMGGLLRPLRSAS